MGQYQTTFDAQLAQGFLESQNIESVLEGEGAHTEGGRTLIRLLVRSADAHRAIHLMSSREPKVPQTRPSDWGPLGVAVGTAIGAVLDRFYFGSVAVLWLAGAVAGGMATYLLRRREP